MITEDLTSDQLKRAKELSAFMTFFGGNPPAAYIRRYVLEGVIDGTLWPIKFPEMHEVRRNG